MGPKHSPLIPVSSGSAYRVASQPANALVTPALAAELNNALERFAAESGFSHEHPVSVFFMPGVVGHHRVGRAADIYSVGGAGVDYWKMRWDAAPEGTRQAAEVGGHNAPMTAERDRNLGWRLYKALQRYGRWSQPPGYPIQLFGPWTRSEGPWKLISDRLLWAHRDHIHVAK